MGGLTSRLRRPRGDPDAGRRWRPRGDPDAVRRRAALAFLGALACLVVLPAANYVTFTGVPFDSAPQYLCLLALLPVIAWPWLRRRWCVRFGSWPVGWLALALAVVVAGVLAKSALFAGGGYEGFAACYRAIYRSEDYIRPRLDDQPPGLCEKAWANPLARFHATRVDPELDFGPGDWNLSFVNDSRFNFYDWRGGSLPRERLPFTAQWRGVVSNPEPRDLALTYVGEAQVWLGATPLTLPPSYAAARTVELEMAPGRHGMVIAYRFDDGYRTGGAPPGLGAVFRLMTRSDDGSRPLRPAAAPARWRLAGRMVDALVVAVAIVLALFWLGVVRAHWKLLLATALAAGVVYSQAGEWQVMGVDVPMTLALVIPGIAVLARSRHPAGLAAAYWCVAALMLAQEAGAAASLDTVLVRRGGSDFLSYESFARSILNTGSLEGGEAVFHYQPLYRYALFVERLLLGDGDVLLPAFVRTALVMAVLYLGWTFRAAEGRLNAVLSIASVALLLALVNTAEVVSLLRRGVSEYPTWIAFPLFFSLFFRTRGGRTALAACVLGLSGITRIDQAPGLLWVFGVRGWAALRARQRSFLLAAGVLAVLAVMPAAHNYAYGDRLVWTTTSATHESNLQFTPAGWLAAWRDDGARAQAVQHLENVLYTGRNTQRLDRSWPWPLYRGLQALWLTALGTVLVAGFGHGFRRRKGRAWESGDLRRLAVLLTPAVFLAPFLFYQGVDGYYPRHIVIGYLAMGAVALYAAAVRRNRHGAAAVPRNGRGAEDVR